MKLGLVGSIDVLPMIIIREEMPGDHESIHALTIDAFAKSELGHHGEAELIERLREGADDCLSLVACSGEAIVGHILITPVTICVEESRLTGMGVAPMSVAPEQQRVGIGTLLVESALTRLENSGCPFVVVLGHPEYYSRFDFVVASRFGVRHGFKGIPQDVFFIKWLQNITSVSDGVGRVYYHAAFGPQHVVS